MMIDIGCNLTHDSFDKDRDQVIADAQALGVEAFMITGSSMACSEKALALAEQHPEVCFATAGIHPHHASEFDGEVQAGLMALLQTDPVKAVGETGLDYFRDFSPREHQIFSFEQHLAMAIELDMPLFLHQRDAHVDFLPIIKAHRDQIKRLVVHCFTDNQQALFDYLDLDCHIGITGWICDERRGQHLLELVHNIPLNRMMIETDAPYLMPRNLKPKPKSRRNEPKYLPHIADFIAAQLNLPSTELITATTATSRAFFEI